MGHPAPGESERSQKPILSQGARQWWATDSSGSNREVDKDAVVTAAPASFIGSYGMRGYRSTGGIRPAQLVIGVGVGPLGESTIERGISVIADLLRPKPS